MLIDFHTHCFPDTLALKAMPKLSGIAKLTPTTDGTLEGLLARMDAEGVDIAVTLHIATSAHNMPAVNRFAASVNGYKGRIYSFGSVHPLADGAVEELYHIRELGLPGVKLHPDYQEYFLGDDRALPVYETCAKLGLPLSFHMGFDPYSPKQLHASPKVLSQLLDSIPDLVVIAAHMGGVGCCDLVEEYLVGKDLYIDTSMSSHPTTTNPAAHRRILCNHRADRLLFGSDVPWSTPAAELAYLEAMELPADKMEAIRHKNARRLLGIG